MKETIYLTPSEMMEYKGYLKLIDESKTVREVRIYTSKAKRLLLKAKVRNS